MMPVLITCHGRVCSLEGYRCRAIGQGACQPFLHRYALLVAPPQVRRGNRQHRPCPDAGTGVFPGLRATAAAEAAGTKARAGHRRRVAATGDGRAS